jgi:hypothetical protein
LLAAELSAANKAFTSEAFLMKGIKKRFYAGAVTRRKRWSDASRPRARMRIPKEGLNGPRIFLGVPSFAAGK